MTAKALKNLFKLSHKVSVYCPTLQVDGEACDNWADKTASLLASLFGGSTSTDAVGYWILSKTGKLQKESVRLVFSYAEELTDVAIDSIYQHAVEMKTACKQDAVAIEVDGDLFFI
ncbi:MAG TPA: hypothetical protein DET40_18485 [Lentisphaeria bacterium]|nr:MAG: hypothetical protein A2X45_14625 [Lentisphaerae bacterium GWF2_50_93]HCE45532.1 hypothetical protein [Lentisphaeria bacterium]